MSHCGVLKEVTEALRNVLWRAVKADERTRDLLGPSIEEIAFTNPTETARQSSAKSFSIWLYQVIEDEFSKNQPDAPASGALSGRAAPLGLGLHYLFTPFAQTVEADQMLLGKCLQTFHDQPVLRLLDESEGGGLAEDLRVTLSRLTLEELSRVWEALREPYRLSLSYRLRVTHIDSLRLAGAPRVVEQTTGYGDAARVGGEESP